MCIINYAMTNLPGARRQRDGVEGGWLEVGNLGNLGALTFHSCAYRTRSINQQNIVLILAGHSMPHVIIIMTLVFGHAKSLQVKSNSTAVDSKTGAA
jgi:hypothetical protein